MKKINFIQFLKELNPILLVLAVLANIAAIIAPLIPNATIWISLFFIVFALLFWMWLLIKRIKRPTMLKKSLEHFHSDWNNAKILDTQVFLESELNRRTLESIESLALRLIIADRLETGGWSKTQTWRFVKTKKPLSPAGTLTGTYFTIEALRPYAYLNSSAAQQLSNNLSKIVMPNGRVKRQLQLTGSGIMEVVEENLRHSSGCFLLRSCFGKSPELADRNSRLRIATQLSGRLNIVKSLKGSKEDKDMMGIAFATAALVAAEEWFDDPDLTHHELVCDSIQMFCNSNELCTPGHPTWGAEGGGSAASQTTAQWTTAWLLCSLNCTIPSDKMRSILTDKLLDLIEANILSVENQSKLLPYAYSRDSSHKPIGESLLATGMACYIAISLLNLNIEKQNSIRARKAIENLLHRIINRGLDYATVNSLLEPYEGYLSWAALLFALRPILHPHPVEFKILSDEYWSGKLINWEDDSIKNTVIQIRKLYQASGVIIKPNGLLQDM